MLDLEFARRVGGLHQIPREVVSRRVSDRGPFVDGLIIDLAKDVFSKLAPMSQGVVQVTISW